MSRSLVWYARVIAMAGLAALSGSVYATNRPDGLRFVCYLLIGVLMSRWKIRLPGHSGTFSLNCGPILTAMVTLPAGEAVSIAACSAVAQSLWNYRKRPALIQVVFNAGLLSLTTAGCQLFLGAMRSMAPDASLLVPLAATATLYFTVNTFLVSIVLALAAGKPFQAIWREWIEWTSLYFLGGALLATLTILARPSGDWASPLLLLPLGFPFYKWYVAEMPEATRR